MMIEPPPNQSRLTEFDPYADRYGDMVNGSIRVSGESVTYFAEYKARYLRRHLAGAARSKVLDYGCGIGLLAENIKRALPRAQVDGFDVSRESLARIPQSLREQGVFTSDPDRLGSDYDAIVVANVLHHVPRSARQAILDSLRERLGTPGAVFIFEHNPLNPLTRRAVHHCEFDRDAVLLPAGETVRYLAGLGLRVRRDYIVFFPRFLAALRFAEPWLAWCFLGGQYVAVGQRPAPRR